VRRPFDVSACVAGALCAYVGDEVTPGDYCEDDPARRLEHIERTCEMLPLLTQIAKVQRASLLRLIGLDRGRLPGCQALQNEPDDDRDDSEINDHLPDE
jgi:hypothetical protein